MNSNSLEISKNIDLENNNLSNVTYEEQKGFLESTLGQVINGGIDFGLKAILPDVIEDEVIKKYHCYEEI